MWIRVRVRVWVIFVRFPCQTVSPVFLRSGLKTFVRIATIGILTRNDTALQVQDLPAIVLSPAQYYNYTQPRGNFIPTSLADHDELSSKAASMSWWSKDADAKRILGTFHLASGVAATCVLKSPFNSSFDADRLRTLNFTSRSQQLLEKYFEAGCESVFVKGLPMMNFVPPAAVIIDVINNSSPLASGK